MKLIQTPSLITGVILGASLITLSAASNDSVLGGLNVFFPGTAVSSTEVNDNFTYLDDGMTTLEGRVDNLEGSSSSSEIIYFQNPSLTSDPRDGTNLTITVPDGYAYRVLSGSAYNVTNSNIFSLGYPSYAINVVIDNFIQSGAGSSVQMPVYELMERRLYDGEHPVPRLDFAPGISLTFITDGNFLYSNLTVCIEKIPFVPVTQNQ